MGDQPTALPRVADERRLQRGFGAFCALLVLCIALLVASPLHTGHATAARSSDRTRSQAGAHGSGAGSSGVSTGDQRSATGSARGHTPGNHRLATLIRAGEPIYCGAGSRRIVALTFDDGPGVYTRRTVKLLRTYGMTATFFEVGKLLGEARFRGLPRLAAGVGAVGDHTWDHVQLVGLAATGLHAQIVRTRLAIASASGSSVFLFRPPLGRHDDRVDAYVRSIGMLEVLWSVDSEDSQGVSADRIFRTVRANLSAGDIILLHENRWTTQRALPRILDLIERKGYKTVTVPQLLSVDPPSREQLRHHTCPA